MVVPQQCSPVMAPRSSAASAPEVRSTASTGPIGKSANMAEPSAGSSRKATSWAWGTRWFTCSTRAVARWRTAEAATRNASSGATPAACRATPIVTGPVTEILIGPRRSVTTFTNARRPTKASEPRPSSARGASGSRAASSMTSEPSSATVMPATPWAAWAIMPSRRLRPGSDGAAGSRGRFRSTKSTASDGSWWGRLPMAVARPTGSRTRRSSVTTAPPSESVGACRPGPARRLDPPAPHLRARAPRCAPQRPPRRPE